jgi:hypothetical protein
MELDIYFQKDIRNALLAANEASAQTAAVVTEHTCSHLTGRVQISCAQCGKEMNYISGDDALTAVLRAYREGYKAALTTVALAFGVAPQAIFPKPFDEDKPFNILEPADAPGSPAHEDVALPRSASWEQP